MQTKCSLILMLLFCSTFSSAQFLKQLNYTIGIGIGVSAGKSIVNDKTSRVNPYSVSYYSHERYKYPSLRIRSSALHEVDSSFRIGIRSGVDIFYFERNLNGELETHFAVPIELITEFKAIKINDAKSVYIGCGIGYKSRKKYASFITRNGGLMASVELFLGRTSQRKSFNYKFGFEYAQENLKAIFYPSPTSGFTQETMYMITSRKLFFVGVGYHF